MNEIEKRPAIDLLDFCYLTAGAACPPLLILAVGQWVLRRNRNAVAWIEQRATRLLEDRLVLPAPTPTPLALPAPPQSPEATTDLLPLLSSSTHLLVIGHTGGGKTTLLHALARHLSHTATVLVCDPDAIAGDYPGYRGVGAGDDYEAIGRALVSVRGEVAQRREQRKRGHRTFSPIWVLVDEAHDVVSELDGAWDILEDLIRRGRKLNVHCAIGTQDAQVKSLGLEGKSKLLDNLVRVDVRMRDGRRVAVIGGSDYGVPDLPNPDDTVMVGRDNDDPLLNALLNTLERSPERSAHSSIVQAHSEAIERRSPERSNQTVQSENEHEMTPDERVKMEQVMALHQQGKSKRESIETAWGVKKGGSPVWKRASELFDAATQLSEK